MYLIANLWENLGGFTYLWGVLIAGKGAPIVVDACCLFVACCSCIIGLTHFRNRVWSILIKYAGTLAFAWGVILSSAWFYHGTKWILSAGGIPESAFWQGYWTILSRSFAPLFAGFLVACVSYWCWLALSAKANLAQYRQENSHAERD